MNILSVIIVFLSTLLPFYHLFNAIDWKKSKRKKSPILPVTENKGFSILIPCYNESMILHTTLEGIEKLRYSNYEVIFINDGSSDATLATLHDLFDLKEIPFHRKKLNHKQIKKFYRSRKYENMYVIDKINGGKADSLNAAIGYATKEYVVSLDADSVLESDSLLVANEHLQDDNIVAAGGMIHILQAKSNKGFLTLSLKNLKNIVLFQVFEYLKGFYIYKKSLAKMNALAIISGAFGIFKRDILMELEGFRETLGEDIDLTIRFQKYIKKMPNKKIVFIPEAICYTECPENWGDLFNQRVRWQKAFIDCVIKHFPFFIKTCLTRTLSFFFLFDALLIGVMGYFYTIISYIYFGFDRGIGSLLEVLSFYAIGSLVCNIIYNPLSLILSRKEGVRIQKKDMLVVIKVMLLDLFFYRFISIFFTMYGTVHYFFNRKSWNKVARTGRLYELKEEKDVA